jgi:phospholipid/cholesterol/gamma-HCH transport system substrate-binding protein
MKYNIIETIVGFMVITVAALFFTFAYKIGYPHEANEVYSIKARFVNVEGVGAGSDIMLGGIKIGSVRGVTIDSDDFKAILAVDLNKDIKLPKDSRFAVSTSGLLGGKYIAVTPGGDEENLKNGDIVKNTQSSINLEELIGKLMYSMTNK